MRGMARSRIRSGFTEVFGIDLTSCEELESKRSKMPLPQRAQREIKSPQRKAYRLKSLCSQFPYLCDLCVKALESLV
jgi:hypothetical protein